MAHYDENQKINYSPDEVEEIFCFSEDEIEKMIVKNPERFKPDYSVAFKRYVNNTRTTLQSQSNNCIFKIVTIYEID